MIMYIEEEYVVEIASGESGYSFRYHNYVLTNEKCPFWQTD